MAEPILRAQLENGDEYDDPVEDALFEILGDIEAGEALWVIVEKLADTTGRTYVQARREDDGTYLVERRKNTPEVHAGRKVPEVRAAHELLTAWAFALSREG